MANLVEKLTKIPLEDRRSLPESPGVYFFYRGNDIIYIGKAINLKRRVSSYFDLDLEPKTVRMIGEADAIGTVKVTSELEALLLEAKLIKSYMPHYNIAAKDDKHPLYIVITKEKFPRVITARKLIAYSIQPMASYGPFPNSANVKSVLRMLRRISPYSDHKVGKRACFYSHIGLCNPCPNEILKMVTHGDKNLKLKIQAVQKYKCNIRNIKKILDGKVNNLQKELEKSMTELSKQQKYEEAKNVRDQLGRLAYITQPQMPTEFYMQNPNLFEDQRSLEIKELKKLLVNCKLKIVNLARIECFDIAHLSGTNPTASMVTFIDGEADKSLYRHFKIKKAKGGDDYDSMREVAKRRALHFDDWGKPDLIIVDGGKGQVESFKLAIPVIGIAKHPDRLIVGSEKIRLTGNALNLVSRMRDEAHRFARRYHHKLVSRELTSN